MNILCEQEKKNLTDLKGQKLSKDIKVSLMEGLSLSEYVGAKAEYCTQKHKYTKVCSCDNLVQAGKVVIEEKMVPLSYLWNKCFTGMTYDCEKAQKRLLQIPLAAITIDKRIYIVEKILNGSVLDYESLIKDFSSSHLTIKENVHTSREEYNDLLQHVAQNEQEKEILKHVLCQSHNLSKREASRLYGISLLRKRAIKVNDCVCVTKEIKEKNLALAKEQKRSILLSYGLDPASILSSDSESNDALTYSSDDDEVSFESSSEDEEDENIKELSPDLPSHLGLETINFDYNVVLDILKEASFNWFSFVILLEEHFRYRYQGHSLAVFDQVLTDCVSLLPNFCLSDEEMRLTEDSRTAYLENLRQKEIDVDRNFDIATDSSDSEESDVEVSSKEENTAIKKKLKQIDDKFFKKAKKEIAEQRCLRRKVSKSTKTIVDRYPDIGDVIESIVQESDIGADNWRRTGVYTFTGDQKKTKRITFSKIQEKLQNHYGAHFSYGSIVQLCVCRHRRRLSSKRYREVANVRYQRARKSFTLKFNPDFKWSRSFYKLLNQLQNDGKHALLLNRDDQAGFRLDSTYTHKNQPVLSVKPTATTHTDFTNKYAAQLQVTSYNFSKTATSDEICVGVVKATGLHEKSPSQHAADLQLVEQLDVVKKAFFVEDHSKEIEFIRVDGGSDEGPSHHEVQFLWTERHVARSTKVTMVTTRCSGDSYLNRVELQNGCLSKGHSNTFIPSTLCGSPYDSEGGLDKQKYKANMSAAVDQYIERVHGTPCMKTKIYLARGAENHIFTERRAQLLTFLKGNKSEKENLKRNNPTLFNYFAEIWQVRNNHIDESLPINYVFMLKCCGRKGCPHPLCIKGKKYYKLQDCRHDDVSI